MVKQNKGKQPMEPSDEPKYTEIQFLEMKEKMLAEQLNDHQFICQSLQSQLNQVTSAISEIRRPKPQPIEASKQKRQSKKAVDSPLRLGPTTRPTKVEKATATKRATGRGGAAPVGDGKGDKSAAGAKGEGVEAVASPAVAAVEVAAPAAAPVRPRPMQWQVRQRRSPDSPRDVASPAPYHVRDRWSPEVSDQATGDYGHSASTIENFD